LGVVGFNPGVKPRGSRLVPLVHNGFNPLYVLYCVEMLSEIRRANSDTRVQYVLMVIFGGLCILAAFSPFEYTLRMTTVGTLFGFTAGIWVSHLVQVLRRAIDANSTVTPQAE